MPPPLWPVGQSRPAEAPSTEAGVTADEQYRLLWREVAVALLKFSVLGLRDDTGDALVARAAEARDRFRAALDAVSRARPRFAHVAHAALVPLCGKVLDRMDSIVEAMSRSDARAVLLELRGLESTMDEIRRLDMQLRAPGVAMRLGTRLEARGDAAFIATVQSHVAAIAATEIGRGLLDALDRSSFAVIILQSRPGPEVDDRGGNVAWALPGQFIGRDGAPGSGAEALVLYNPDRWRVGPPIADPASGRTALMTRPPEVGLFRQLFHAWRATTGTTPAGEGIDAGGTRKPLYELEAARYADAFAEQLLRARQASGEAERAS